MGSEIIYEKFVMFFLSQYIENDCGNLKSMLFIKAHILVGIYLSC